MVEKDWSPKLAVIDAVIGLAVCIDMMIIQSSLSETMKLTVQLELIALIPYLLKMQRINPSG